MKRTLLHFGVVAFVFCVALTACKKTNVASSASDPQLNFVLQSDNPSFTFASAGATNGATGGQAFSWNWGIASITKFRMSAKRGGMPVEYSSSNLTNVDLFSLVPSLSSISIPKGDYTEVKTTTIFTQTNGTDFPVILKGTYVTGAGGHIPAEFDLNDNLEINVQVNNIIADGSKDFTTKIALHLNLFLNSISAQEIDAATRTNGTILINKTINTSLYNKIKGNMLACAASTLLSAAKK
ncbi:hypothetical protein [Mucilaginibacter paludis]|uniref:DUF4382 domain-containing protein n=1 Tax=Mucilaginibacter paludis DSM 18603 TaxID=714943 RepID=H1YEX1_9SPHI|nr:hypothetical protein [Mucilaginibacter paludis]EHQ24388.1 hypothetical protein Mucpa_0188 [Mucilaginibacter paludis DSM 18603]